jgi:pimeloyl-ACP methyl ester carboxylesterase
MSYHIYNLEASSMVNADDKAVQPPYTGFFAITPPPPSDPSIIEADGGKWIRLPSDGRLVEYFVHGSTKTDAAILVDCPGGGCTGALVGKLPGVVEWCEAHNVKIISPSYPGFGYSEVRPGWTIGEWPKSDLEPILEQEGVTDSFLVTGTSFGTPHAQAVAVYFGERVKVLGLRVPYVGRHVSEDVGLPLGQANMRYDSKSCNTNLIGHVIGKAFMSTVSIQLASSMNRVGLPGR